MIVLGIDPGLVQTGYGLIKVGSKDNQVIDYGTISTNAKDRLALRLLAIYNDLISVINKYKPSVMAIEEVFYGKNVKSALLLGHARGVPIVCASKKNIPVFEYSARKIKQSLTGNGNAHKDQVRFMVKNLLKLDTTPKSKDSSDALAAALCYMLQNRLGDL